MAPKWHKRAWELHKRYIRQAQLKERLTSEGEVVNYFTLAICGEAGELANLIKKAWRGEVIDQKEIREEMADIRIYLEHLARELNFNLDQACEQKIDEVARRVSAKENVPARRSSRRRVS